MTRWLAAAALVATATLTGPTLAGAAPAASSPRVRVEGGTYRPAFPASPSEAAVPVAPFAIDRTPVTNAQYKQFVTAHPEWRRDRVKSLFADASYLAHWRDADELGDARPSGPVVRVSWFAARAYCKWRGGRLPLEKEWELVAADVEDSRVLAWYAGRSPKQLPDVGKQTNARGIADLHGLIWEWVDDFNAALVSADSRGPTRDMFCGGAAASSANPRAYATFMRLAFRSSLEARYTTELLGFRCAYDEKTP